MRPLRRREQGSDVLEGGGLMSLAEDGGSWAVAYADLLMVLMSFFVIFSSLGTESAKDSFYQIAMSLTNHVMAGKKDVTGLGAGDGAGSGIKSSQDKSASLAFPQNVFEKLAQNHLHYVQEGKSILITFEGDQFTPGNFALSDHMQEQLVNVAQALQPYSNSVEVLLIGHADSKAVTHKKNRFLQDNFDLSSQRALSATRFLALQGLPSNHLLSQASSDNEISRRSLSIRISAYKGHEQ